MVSRGSGERALESHSRPLLALSLSLQYAIRSFVNRPVTLSARRTPSAYLALSLARPVVVSSVGVPARHRQTRGLSQSITEDLTAPLKKNLPRTERTDGQTDADERALGGAGGGLGVQWGRPFQDAPGQSAKSLEKLAKRNALSGRTRRRTRQVMDRKRDCFPSWASFPFPFRQMRVNQQT